MENSELLSAEDNLFGRVALYNQLVTPDQVAECTRAIFVEAVANLPRRTLAEILVAHGYLSAEVARSITESVRRKLPPDVETEAAAPAQAAEPPGSPVPARRTEGGPAPRPPAAPPERARGGASRVMVRTEPGAGPSGERIWVEAPEGSEAATVKVGCMYLYPNDAPALALACREMLALQRPELQVDLRAVDYVPSVIFGEIARAGLDASAQKRRLTLLAKRKVAAVAEMIVGRIVTVVGT